MLDHIDTGYEGKFDFPPHPARPEVTYLLASVPRAGSTHFSHLLWQTGCLGAPLEYLNFDPNGPYGFAAASREAQVELWRSVQRRRCSPNGVFGIKAFPMQLQQLQQSNPSLLADVLDLVLPRDRQRRIIYLRRRDRVAQTVSYARASLSGVWRREQEASGPQSLDYSDEALEAAEHGIAFQERVWERMFNDLRLEPLVLWHEDILAAPQRAAEEVAQHLGVTIDPTAAVDVPQIVKQSIGDAHAWAERYVSTRG